MTKYIGCLLALTGDLAVGCLLACATTVGTWHVEDTSGRAQVGSNREKMEIGKAGWEIHFGS